MQIDFHHAVTYICARLAGFPAADADIIAHSAQYVDDATAEGDIWFDNGMIFPRTASAHKMLDYKNTDELANHRVWLPFHFLPGNNQELPAVPIPSYGAEEFMRRCVCRPNSYPAKELMRCVVERQDRPYALYRLGIAAHVFMDTWAHQGFVGYKHKINISTDIDADDDHHDRNFADRLKDFFGEDWAETKSEFVGAALPLGHGTVLSYPDRPYLRWSYTNGLKERIERNNPKDFLEAARQTYQHFRRYLDFPALEEKVFETDYELPSEFDVLGAHIAGIRDEEGDARHQRWLGLISSGAFGFSENLSYIDKGIGSWKCSALGTVEDVGDMDEFNKLPLPAPFLSSHWKLFHDALQAHRFFVLHELLPKYGLLSG